jgi:hypothetical protein
MSVRHLLAAAALAALPALSLAAQTARAPVHISVQVVRSCRVMTTAPQVSVDCGRRPQAVEVRQDQSAPTRRTISAATEVAPSSARTVTVDF